MEIVIAFFVFCIILFLYLHIQFHLKTSDDLEIYEIDHVSKEKMEEVCDLRQPVLFDLENNKIIETTNKDYLLKNYPVFEVKIRSQIDNEHVPLTIQLADKLFQEDKTVSYFSENNSDFLQETGVFKHLQYNDEFLRPPMVSNCYYDILMGTANSTTPFRYELNYRNFFMVTQGSVQIKLSPPKSVRYLYPINDYEKLEFRSSINPWNVAAKYSADFDKIKCLEIKLLPGKFIYIPAYWWYSIKFGENTSVSCLSYRTYMNNIAISPNIIMYGLQNQNIKHEIVKKINIEETKLTKVTNSTVDPDFKDDTNNIVKDVSENHVSENNVSNSDGTNISEL
jgi:hypothetical protein